MKETEKLEKTTENTEVTDKTEAIEKEDPAKVEASDKNENSKINRSCFISNACTCALAAIIMFAEGLHGHFTTLYAIAMICTTWASILHFCKFFVEKKKWPVLIGAALSTIAALFFLYFYIKTNMA